MADKGRKGDQGGPEQVVPRTSSYRFTPFGADGLLTVDAIEALVRRVWWSDGESRWEPDGRRVKFVGLWLWWPAERWPAWWPWSTDPAQGPWIDCGDGLEARTCLRDASGDPASGRLEVRRKCAGG